MQFARLARARVCLGALLVVVLLGAALLVGCTRSGAKPPNAASSSETSQSLFPATTPNPGTQPPPPALKDPRTSVYSYMLWISYAYRVLNSDVASMTFDPYEEVRVNSYVMYNLQEGRAIDQKILSANLKSWESKGTSATVAMHEDWAYRYIDTTTGKYTTPRLNASYETTYTVVNLGGNWVVHSVEATSAVKPK